MFLWLSVRPLKPLKLEFFKEFKVGNFDKIYAGKPVFISTESNLKNFGFLSPCIFMHSN